MPAAAGRTSRGQSLIEFALVLPILLLLLVMAIDFGRLFFGWVALTNAARVGANYAALHPTGLDLVEYRARITADAGGINCTLATPPPPSFTTPDGTPTSTPQLGDFARVELQCAFALITPLAGSIIGGDEIDLDAEATFPVRNGCANCPSPAPAPTPVPPDHCRLIPTMTGMSVAGARLAWQSAGFSVSKFSPATGQDTETVAPTPAVTEDDPSSTCPSGYAIFSSSVVVTTEPPDPVVPPCQTVPNLIGLTVGDARTEWTVGPPAFTGGFQPTDQDAQVVTGQTTTPASTPGVSCIEATASIVVTHGAAWASAPPAPCKVPNFTDKQSSTASGIWTGAGFSASRISYDGPQNGFKIKSQTLVGGDYVACDSAITVSNKPNAP